MCECFKNQWVVYFNHVDSMACELHLNKPVIFFFKQQN